jgi:hypothetical protein
MDLRQVNSLKHLQQAINTDLKSLKESALARLCHNSLSPVSSLPPEVFTAIFSLLCLPGASSQGGRPDRHLARLHVSHVCHQWREIALNHPLLWSHVDFTTLSSAAAAEILVRAKSVPLYLDASIFGRRWDNIRFSAFQRELQACVPYIHHLRTSAEPTQLRSTLEGLVSPAPILEYLSLSSHSTRRNKRSIVERVSIPDTLFDGFTPRLSCLELRNCGISWNSPLLKGLKYLEILTPSAHARPKLTVWLDALDEMPQLKTLTLHSTTSPIAPPFPADVKRTVSLPSLTRLDILASPGDCALALAHLDLPALTCLCLTAISNLLSSSAVEKLLPYITRHSHGPQDAQPLQSVLIRTGDNHADILAWSVPNFYAEVHNRPALLATTVPTRVALSFRSNDWPLTDFVADNRIHTLCTVMAGLPLENLVTLAAHDLSSHHEGEFPMMRLWSLLSPKCIMLQRVGLGPLAAQGLIVMLLQDEGEHERPLFPLLRELTMIDFSLYPKTISALCKAFMQRVEQGVPLEMLDLRMCDPPLDDHLEYWLRSLSEMAVKFLGPEGNPEAREQMRAMWETVARGPFRIIDNEDNYSATDLDDDDDDLMTREDTWRMGGAFPSL